MCPYDSVLVRGSGPTYSATPGAHPLIPEDAGPKIPRGLGTKTKPKAPKNTTRRPSTGKARSK